jgi:ABC-type uncharacterized transport system involved in gliding motility auxiliary subunit
MAFKWLKTRQSKYTGYVALYLIIIIAVLAAANWLANRHNKSVDLTANKRYSLSDQTEKVVKNLQSDVKITYFDQTGRFPQAKDLLDRYDNLSPKLQIEYIDPDKKPAVAKTAGVRTYGTIFVNNGPRQEEAKSLTEEEITGALIRTLKSGERTVCFVTGSGEHGMDDTERSGYSSAKEALEKNNYKTRTISLLGADRQAPAAPATIRPGQAATEQAAGPGVPQDCTIIVVAGPRYEYTDPAVNALKTYVENGGRGLFMLDPPLSLGREETRANPALEKLIDSWGVTLNRNLVVDTSGIGQIFGLSEVVPLVTNYESHPIVREMRDVATAFPLARSLEAKAGAEKLFSTTDNSYAVTNLASAEIRIDPAKDTKGPLPLGAAATVNGKARIVVVGSSNWAANNIIRFNGNRDLFLNMMNWLSSDEDLISIRPKDPEDRRLNLTRRQMSILFWSSVVFLPLIVIGSGLAVWWRRR